MRAKGQAAAGLADAGAPASPNLGGAAAPTGRLGSSTPAATSRYVEAARLSEAGMRQLAQGRIGEAVRSQQAAAALWPESGAIECNLGAAFQQANRLAEAEAAFRRAAELQPELPEPHNNLGNLYLMAGRVDAALASLRRAVELRSSYADAWCNLGNALVQAGRMDAAEEAFGRACAAAPGHAAARRNLAVILSNRANREVAANRLDEALASYGRARELDPASADIEYNECLARLVRGDFAGAWKGYERRRECTGKKGPRVIEARAWDGREPVAGRSILVWAEQGLGDTLQFARYLRRLHQLGADVLLEAQPALHELLRSSFPFVRSITTRGQATPRVDFHCAFPSLPGAFATRMDTIPGDVPYLALPFERRIRWAQRLAVASHPRVGLVWAGNPGHQNDANRSMPLATMLRAVEGCDAWLLALQKNISAADRALLAGRPDIVELGDELGDFADTAAVAMELDLVITVDTSMAHLAGALAKPVWVLLPYAPDWRWLLERSDSPWYPTARLFRQASPGDWGGVVERVKAELRKR